MCVSACDCVIVKGVSEIKQNSSIVLRTCSSVSKSLCFTVPASFSGTVFRTQSKQRARCKIYV